jgi:PAS domain S-box-containing protein
MSADIVTGTLAAMALDRAADAVLWAECDGRIVYANDALVELLGYPREDLMDMNVQDLDPVAMAEDWDGFWQELKDVGTSRFETSVRCRDGSWLPLEISASLMEHNGHALVSAFIRDVAERRQAEEALRAEEERYRALFDDNPTMFFTLDTNGVVLSVNRYGATQLGYTAEELVGESVLNVFYPPDRESVAQQLQECLRSPGRVRSWEFRKIRKDGSMLWVKEAVRAVRDSEGNQVVLVVCEDITARKLAEEELAQYRDQLEVLVRERTRELTEANEKLQQEIAERRQAQAALAAEKERLAVTLRSMGEGVIVTDASGNVGLMNGVAEALTGWIEREALGRPLDQVLRILNERTREPLPNPAQEVREAGGTARMDDNVVLIAHDGLERIVSASSAPVRDREGELVGVVLVLRDITERRQMEAELLKSQKLESIGVLAGGLAHDFNNLLTAIMGNLSVARLQASPGDPIVERLAVSERACVQAKSLADQLLTFSKGGAPVRRPTDLALVIRDSAEFVLRGSNVRCEFHMAEDLWQAEIDAGQINQALSNLILNADQSMPDGGVIVVRAENEDVSRGSGIPIEPGRYIKVSVSDQGVGIAPEHVEKIFDPYFTSKQRGSGLGLTTAYSVVRRHGGTISVFSELGKGTTFVVYLPAATAEAPESDVAQQDHLAGHGRVLVMDDDGLIRDTAAAMLGHFGYDVAVAEDGEAAVELYRRGLADGEPFDVVILDLTVPGGVGGTEALQQLKQIDPDVRAIVSSGYSTDPALAHHQEAGFAGVVAKPYEVEELAQVVRGVLLDAS